MGDSNALMGILCCLFIFCGAMQGNPSCFLYYIFYMLLSFIQTLSIIGLAVQNQLIGTGLAALFKNPGFYITLAYLLFIPYAIYWAH